MPELDPRKRTKRIIAALAAAAVVGGGIYLGVSLSGGNPAPKPVAAPTHKPSPKPTRKPPPPPPPPNPHPFTGEGVEGHVIAVKIDNVGPAQFEQSGLNAADLVYVIHVEGGLSRYLAIFDSDNSPARVGPVRSARQTDIPLLSPYGRIGLVYSGAILGLYKYLYSASLQNINPLLNMGVFSNYGGMPTYIRPAQVFSEYPHLAQAQDVGFRFGAEPPGGQPDGTATAHMPAASFVFTASGTMWLVSVDGHPLMTIDMGRADAANVIIQHVNVVPGRFTDHNAAQPANEVYTETTGQGAADFYRNGRVWHGTWSKPSITSQAQYLVGGKPMLLQPGRTWIVLEG